MNDLKLQKAQVAPTGRFLETVRKGLVIVPMVGTHATKHWYGAYQPLVHAVPTTGIHSIQYHSHDDMPPLGCLSLLSGKVVQLYPKTIDARLLGKQALCRYTTP